MRAREFNTLFFLIFLGLVIFISLVAISSYRSNQAYKDASNWVKRTLETLNDIEQISSASKDLQLESAGYYYTGDTIFLNRFVKARNLTVQHVTQLRELTIDNPAQQQLHDSLQALVKRLILFANAGIEAKAEGRYISDSIHFRQRLGYRESISLLLRGFAVEEARLLTERERRSAIAGAAATKTLYYLIGAVFGLLVASFFLVWYYLKKRKESEKYLLESDKRFQLLVNNIKDFDICITDRKGTILDYYCGAETISGFPREEIVGKSISVFYTGEDIAKNIHAYNLQMAAENNSYETQGWRTQKSGAKYWANMVIRTIGDEPGATQGFIMVTRNFTMYKKAEDEMKQALKMMREANELKSNFVSMASHEFRTPLSTILSSASLIAKYTTVEMQSKRESHVQKITSAVSVLKAVLEEFLSLEKIESGVMKPKASWFDLKQLTSGICDEAKLMALPGQAIEYTYAGDEFVCLDADVVRHILSNLVSNAIKYSPDGSGVEFHIEVAANRVHFSVKDHGIGISQEDQVSLFQRFFRAGNTAGIEGTGLGLHIVKRYVDMMKGTIQVTSEPGKGAEFIVGMDAKHSNSLPEPFAPGQYDQTH